MQDVLDRATEVALMGFGNRSSDDANEVYQNYLGYQFECFLDVEQPGGDCGFKLVHKCVDRHALQDAVNAGSPEAARFNHKTSECFSEAEILSKTREFAQEVTENNALEDEVEQRLSKPVRPQLKMKLAEDLVKPGDVLKVNIELLDRFDDTPVPDARVALVHTRSGSDSQESRHVDPTDSDGKVTVDVLVVAPGKGLFEVSYTSEKGANAASIKRGYEVNENAGSRTGEFLMRNIGRLGLKPGETTELLVALETSSFGVPNPPPLADGKVKFGIPRDDPQPDLPPVELALWDCSIRGCPTVSSSPGGGTLLPETVQLGESNPSDTVLFTAGATPGLATVHARFECSLCDPNSSFYQRSAEIVINPDVQFSASVGGSGSSSAHLVSPHQATGPVPIQASLIVGDSFVEAQAVQFLVDGDGGISTLHTQTDAFGLAGTTFVPPLSLSDGSSGIVATAVVDGETYTATVDVEYEALDLTYRVTEIHDYDSFTFNGWAVNSDGVVGGAYWPFDGDAALWLPEPLDGRPAGMNELPVLPGAISPSGFVRGINDSRQAVGFSSALRLDTNSDQMRAVLWANGSVLNLGNLTGADPGYNENSFHEAKDINENGVIVGDADSRPFIWEPGGPMRNLGGLSMNDRGIAHAVNSQGQAVGGSALFTETEDFGNVPVIWPAGPGSIVQLSSENSTAFDINDAGQVLFATRIDHSIFSHSATLWLWENGQSREIITYGPFSQEPGFQAAINNAGMVLVGSITFDASGILETPPFLWRNGDSFELNDLLHPDDANWTVISVKRHEREWPHRWHCDPGRSAALGTVDSLGTVL